MKRSLRQVKLGWKRDHSDNPEADADGLIQSTPGESRGDPIAF